MEAALDNRVFMHDYLREFFEQAVAEGQKDAAKKLPASESEFDASPYTQLFVKFLMIIRSKVYENTNDVKFRRLIHSKRGSPTRFLLQQPQYRMV